MGEQDAPFVYVSTVPFDRASEVKVAVLAGAREVARVRGVEHASGIAITVVARLVRRVTRVQQPLGPVAKVTRVKVGAFAEELADVRNECERSVEHDAGLRHCRGAVTAACGAVPAHAPNIN